MELWVLDKNLNKIGIISSFISLTFDRAFCSEGSFELKMNANTRGASYLVKNRIIYLDSKRTGVIKYVNTTRSNNKSGEMIIAKGYELKDEISSRITIPPLESSTGYDTYSNEKTDYIARQLLLKHIIEPENSKRQIDIFKMAPYQAYGSIISFSTRYKSLADEVYSLLATDNLGIECDVDIDLKIATLRIVNPTDRSINQNENKRAIFAIQLGTLLNTERLIDSRSYKNHAYVGGQGEGAERAISEIYTTETEAVGIDRKELFVDARDIQDISELPQRGLNKLSELEELVNFEGEIRDIGSMTYDLGDLVTIIDSDNTAITKQIVGIGFDYIDGSIINKRVTFGSNQFSLSKAISKRLKDINNELTR